MFASENQTIVEGSVALLYCQVNSAAPTLIVTWTRNGVPLVPNDVPNIHMRNSTSGDGSTMFLLIVDTFEGSASYGNGTYQCIAEDGRDMAVGAVLTFTGILQLYLTIN